MGNCAGCLVADRAKRLPYYCSCGLVYIGPNAETIAPRLVRPRTFGGILREMVGCSCPIGWRKWDARGLDWCRDNAGKIAARLAREPNTGLDSERAAEMVRLAIEIASRQAGDGQQANQVAPSE